MPRSRRVLFDIGAAGPWAGVDRYHSGSGHRTRLVEGRAAQTSPRAVSNSATRSCFTRLAQVDSARRSRHGQRGPQSDRVRRMARALRHRAQSSAGQPTRWRPRDLCAVRTPPSHHFAPGRGRMHPDGRSAVLLGKSFWYGWLFWAVMLFAFGLGHPVTADIDTPLDPLRRFAAWATIALFIVTFSPVPFAITAPSAPDQQQDEKLYSVMHDRPAVMRRRRSISRTSRSDRNGRRQTRSTSELGSVLHDDHAAGGRALDLPAREGRRGDRARSQHPRDRLQWLARGPAALPRCRMPHLRIEKSRWRDRAELLSHDPRGDKCDHAGGAQWRADSRRRHLRDAHARASNA